MPIDVERLLAEISPDNPCGDNLEYDPAFVELEQAAAGTPEKQKGDTVIPAEDPDWADVENRALELLERTKDMRVAYQLARACLRTGGIPSFTATLAVMRGYVERYWDGYHPRLDPDDDNDPTIRVNIVAGLANYGAIVGAIRQAPLVASRAVGRFNLHDYAIAAGTENPPPEADPEKLPKMSTIESAVMDSDPEAIRAMAAAAADALDHAVTIERTLGDLVGAGGSADLSDLRAVLKELKQATATLAARREGGGSADQAGAEGAVAVEAGGEGGALPAAAAGATVVVTAGIRNRDDVTRRLDELCEYFERNEPSSPVPLLLRRAKRLVARDFMAILEDLLPDAVSEAQRWRGNVESSE
ncbi:MAG: type VI secretion system protein TssA [Gammaproteobacteria bacterium]